MVLRRTTCRAFSAKKLIGPFQAVTFRAFGAGQEVGDAN